MNNIQHSQSKSVQYLSLCATDMDNGQFIQILHLHNEIIFVQLCSVNMVNQEKIMLFSCTTHLTELKEVVS